MLKATNQSNSASYIYIYIYRAALTLLLILLPALISLSSIVFASSSASAAPLTYSVTIDPSLTINLEDNLVRLDLNPVSNPFDSHSLNVTVSTNNATGYYMTMSTTNDNTNLINTNNPDYYIPTLPGSGSIPDCSAGCSESNFPANKWGYKIGESSVYLPFVSGVTVAENTAPAISDTTNLTFASKVDYDTRAGLYATTLNFTAVSKPVPVYMQYITSSACTATPLLVTDIRDGEEYYIQRLADGKCWMLDNLNLDLTDADVVNSLTNDNTNIDTESDPYALESLKSGARSHGDKYATSGLTRSNWTSGRSYSAPLVNIQGTCRTDVSVPCAYNGSYTNNTILSTLVPNSTFGVGQGKIGVYYNYCATSMGTYCYGDGNNDGGNPPTFSSPTSDICPKKWQLSSANEVQNLLDIITENYPTTATTATSSDSIQYKLSMPLSGGYTDTLAWRQGEYGNFWSSTYSSKGNMKRPSMNTTSVNPNEGNNRFAGISVRCLLQE